MSIEALKSQFFSDNIITDLKLDPQYGIIPLPMTEGMTDLVLNEAYNSGVEVIARTAEATDFRRVQCWRINQKDSITAELLNHAVLELNKEFNYRLSGIQDIQYLEYHAEDDAYYDWHSDIGDGLACTRKISISWVLNEGFEGGDLQFFGDGGNVLTMNSTPNKLIGFTSFLNHRITPVTKGIRKCVVAWVFGNSWR
tara:strand:- start:294 stop:884 length:591 start_codon:yes stop_codon:yes gene_type:complete